MGKDLKGKELGKGITQESTGLYSARFVDCLERENNGPLNGPLAKISMLKSRNL